MKFTFPGAINQRYQFKKLRQTLFALGLTKVAHSCLLYGVLQRRQFLWIPIKISEKTASYICSSRVLMHHWLRPAAERSEIIEALFIIVVEPPQWQITELLKVESYDVAPKVPCTINAYFHSHSLKIQSHTR